MRPKGLDSSKGTRCHRVAVRGGHTVEPRGAGCVGGYAGAPLDANCQLEEEVG